MVRCPKCKRLTLADTRVCPNCGEVLPPMPELTGDAVVKLSQRPPLQGGKEWAVAVLGFLVGLLSPLLFCIGFVIVGIVYLATPRRDSPFMRGLGYGLIGATVVLLGALAICLYSMR